MFSLSTWFRNLGYNKGSNKTSHDPVAEAWAFIKGTKNPRLRAYLSANLKYMLDESDTLDPPHKPKGVKGVSEAINRLDRIMNRAD